MILNPLTISAFLFFVAALLSAQEYKTVWIMLYIGLESNRIKVYFWLWTYYGFLTASLICMIAWILQ